MAQFPKGIIIPDGMDAIVEDKQSGVVYVIKDGEIKSFDRGSLLLKLRTLTANIESKLTEALRGI